MTDEEWEAAARERLAALESALSESTQRFYREDVMKSFRSVMESFKMHQGHNPAYAGQYLKSLDDFGGYLSKQYGDEK